MTDGVLVIDKPAGMTSHDVVDAVRRRFGTRRVGHAGTLDPDATGILVVGLGRATRFLSFTQMSDKGYRAVARFGTTTTTQDASGDVLETRPVTISRADVETAARSLTGRIEQVPPMVSAVKVGGERLYRKARRGESVEREPRPVTIARFDLVDLVLSDPPEATFEITCSAGTYVRTLVHDLGERLGCGAHLKTLRRTHASGFREDDAVPLDAVDRNHVRPLTDAVRTLPRVHVDAAAAALVASGRKLAAGSFDAGGSPPEGAPVALLHDGELLGVYRREGEHLVAARVVAA